MRGSASSGSSSFFFATAAVVLLTALLATSFPAATAAADKATNMADHGATPGVLYIQGEGSLTVAYDKAKVRVSITSKSMGINTASLAQASNSETVTAFMTALADELSIGKQQLKTEHMNLNPLREYKDRKSYVIGYQASITLCIDVSTEDKTLVPQIHALASRFEADQVEVNVQGAQAYVSEARRKENFVELFDKTMEDARFKAELYARGVGRTLGTVLVMSDRPIQTQNISPQPRPMAKAMRMAPRGGGEEMAMAATEMEMPLGEGQKLSKVIHLQYELLN